ncbi:MAG: hypothetical protein H6883_11805 [Rhodobiaceae bacterium]|nr:hypothetical protein [Rhodobiaceae bacterium]MCC0056810.1 hypothetical protein [Rhodobiaceae bacterium]
MLLNFPLMLVPLVVYNLFSYAEQAFDWRGDVFATTMVSGETWTMTYSDLIILLSLVLLFLEVVKSTRIGAGSIVDHLLSTAVFVAFLVEFLLVGKAATSTFFILMVVALIDVIAGFTVTIRAARRDFSVGPA